MSRYRGALEVQCEGGKWVVLNEYGGVVDSAGSQESAVETAKDIAKAENHVAVKIYGQFGSKDALWRNFDADVNWEQEFSRWVDWFI